MVEGTLDWADELYTSGDRGVIDLSLRSALAIIAARRIYADIGRVFRERGCDVTKGRAFTSRARKIVLICGGLGRLLISVPRRLWLTITGRGRLEAPDTVLTFDAMFSEPPR